MAEVIDDPLVLVPEGRIAAFGDGVDDRRVEAALQRELRMRVPFVLSGPRPGGDEDRQFRQARRQRGAEPQELAEMRRRSEEHTSELQSLMRISYAVFCLKKKNNTK